MNDEAELPERVRRNRVHWDALAAEYAGPGERAWARSEPAWGIWGVPESDLHALPEDLTGKDAIELGCGTVYVSAWLARRGARVVGIDNSAAQLATARRLQREHGLNMTLIHGNAERVPYPEASFDLAISEFGACLYADPYRSRPGGGPYPASWRRAHLPYELSPPHALRVGGRRPRRERPVAAASVWGASDRVARRYRNACIICQVVARRLLPLKDRWQFFATERGVSGGFIPCNVSHGMLGLAFGNFLIPPTARPRQACQVIECAESLLQGRLVTLSPVFLQSLADDPLKLRRRFGRAFGKWRRFVPQNCCNHLACRSARKRSAPHDHFVKHHTQTEDVCPSIQLLATSLLRRHIPWRPHNYPGLCVCDSLQRRSLRVHQERGRGRCRLGQLGESEIEHYDDPVAPRHHISDSRTIRSDSVTAVADTA